MRICIQFDRYPICPPPPPPLLGCFVFHGSVGLLFCPARDAATCYRPESDNVLPTAFNWAAGCSDDGNDDGDSDPNGCLDIFVVQDCDDAALCSWDRDTCRPFACSDAQDGTECAAVATTITAASERCIWLEESGICMAPGEEVSCRRFTSCQQCPPERCNFDLGSQSCVAWTGCTNIDEFTEAACTAIPNCVWNANGCVESGGGSSGGCTAVGSQDHEQTCKDIGSCIWSPTVFAVGPVRTASPVAGRVCYDPPTAAPATTSPTAAPSPLPTAAPTTLAPTAAPTAAPTTLSPTASPATTTPTTGSPTPAPSPSPTPAPSLSPTPVSPAPSQSPTSAPSRTPFTLFVPTDRPTAAGPDDQAESAGDKKEEDDDTSGLIMIAAIVVGVLVVFGIGVITLLLRKRAKQSAQRTAHRAGHAAHQNQAYEKDKAEQGAQPKQPGQPGQPATAATVVAAPGTVQNAGGRKVLMLGRNEDAGPDC